MDRSLKAYIPWLEAWNLTPDGKPFETEYTGSLMLPVRQGMRSCMLKIVSAPEEIRGSALMTWWNGDGAAEVLAHSGSAILLDRAISLNSLAEMSRRGDDDKSLSILCRMLTALHSPRNVPPPPNLTRLAVWFQDLTRLASADTLLALWSRSRASDEFRAGVRIAAADTACFATGGERSAQGVEQQSDISAASGRGGHSTAGHAPSAALN